MNGKREMTDRELMQMALDALQKIYIAPEHEEYIRVWWPACEEAIKALRDRLAQPEYDQTALELCDVCGWKAVVPDEGCLNCKRLAQPEREWVGLTDEDVHNAFNFTEMVKQFDFDRDRQEWCENFAAHLEAKLKENNS
jgi:hypothetical protein